MENLKELCSVFLPKDTLKYFNITDVSVEDDEIHINLTEKNNPPVHTEKLRARGFKTITVSDFPIRGKGTVLTYHRRYWKTEKTKKLITSDIPLVHTGTKLEQDFAEVLKKNRRRRPRLPWRVSRLHTDSRQRSLRNNTRTASVVLEYGIN